MKKSLLLTVLFTFPVCAYAEKTTERDIGIIVEKIKNICIHQNMVYQEGSIVKMPNNKYKVCYKQNTMTIDYMYWRSK